MHSTRLSLLICAALIAIATPSIASPASSYDGLWNVTVITGSGSCPASSRYPLTVSDGRVAGPSNVTGTVSRSGNVKVSLGGAYANGMLNGNAGSGRWNGASAGVPCSGHWEASRQ